MSDRMRAVPFGEMLNWIKTEYQEQGTIFGVNKLFKKTDNQRITLFGEHLELPVGPAAGPHNQLAQNIISAYIAGARFFELKTVQPIDGEDLPVEKPCIAVPDECYNCEWSTELTVPEAYDEYVKAWFIIKLLSAEYGFGSPDGFIFNMSVGYDFEGVKSEKIDRFINGMINAEDSPIWQECMTDALAYADNFENIDAQYIRQISPHVSRSITLSTLHGCPPSEIERIAAYLIEEKGLHTFVKCNPTMLGYDDARAILDSMGYDYMDFDDYHFLHDLQFVDAVPMFGRLKAQAADKGVAFGVKITNTFPQKVVDNILPSEDMYMSGRSLFPCSLELARRLAEAFDGDLQIAYSGGADHFNVADIFKTGVWPITVATTLLKPGGYNRMAQMADDLSEVDFKAALPLKPAALAALAASARKNSHHVKGSIKPLPTRKIDKKVPLVDCFTAPCTETCPISQDIPEYIALVGENKYEEALSVITRKNALPFITGTICTHRCMDKCTRNFYDEAVCIRDVKLEAANFGFDSLLKTFQVPEAKTDAKVAIIGGGPAGMSAAFFLARAGVSVTIFEKRDALGGIVNHVIPDFRIDQSVIGNDIRMLEALGVSVVTGRNIENIDNLKAEGFNYVVVATGAWAKNPYQLEGQQPTDVLEFLADFNKDAKAMDLGSDVVVIGGGNTAMDAARAATRISGVENVRLVYRRTKRYMPADEEELQLALEDGVRFYECLAPEAWDGSSLTLREMVLGAPDESGRRRPEPTDKTVSVPATAVIAAVGAKVDDAWFDKNKISTDKRGCPEVNDETLKARDDIFVVGDAQLGPDTVVRAIADARKATDHILGLIGIDALQDTAVAPVDYSGALDKRGILDDAGKPEYEAKRCLECQAVCESCADVCPNRANIAIAVPGYAMRQIIHVDRMCNECGNCACFCPYDSAPYKDKFTLFHTVDDLNNSENEGFLLGKNSTVTLRLNGETTTVSIGDASIPKGINGIIESVVENYQYLI